MSFSYGTSIGDIVSRAKYEEGDVLETSHGTRLVIVELIIDVTHFEIQYRVDWRHNHDSPVIPEESLTKIQKVGEREEPYYYE